MRYLFWTCENIGDTVIDMTVFNAIVRLDPRNHVEVYASKPPYHELLMENPNIAKIHVKPKEKRGYYALHTRLLRQSWDVLLTSRNLPSWNLFFLLCRAKHKCLARSLQQYNPPNEYLTRLSLLDGILPGWQNDIDPSICFKEERINVVAARLGLAPNARILTIGPGASEQNKIWHKDKFITLINQLKGNYNDVLIIGSTGEAQLCSYIADKTGSQNIAGQLGILDLCALLTRTSLHLGNDSGLGHVAAVVGSPCLSIGSRYPDHRFCPWNQHQLIGAATTITVDEVISELNRLSLIS